MKTVINLNKRFTEIEERMKPKPNPITKVFFQNVDEKKTDMIAY
jgi:hypothetical protein